MTERFFDFFTVIKCTVSPFGPFLTSDSVAKCRLFSQATRGLLIAGKTKKDAKSLSGVERYSSALIITLKKQTTIRHMP